MQSQSTHEKPSQESLEATHRADIYMYEIFKRLENSLQNKKLSFLGYSNQAIAARLTQIVVRDFYPAIMRLYANGVRPINSHICLNLKKSFQNAEISFDPIEARILVPIRLRLKQFLKIIGGLGLFGIKIFLAAISRKRHSRQVSILINPSLEAIINPDTLNEEFAQYCARGPLSILRDDATLLVQTEKPHSAKNSIYFCTSPWQELFLHTSWSWSEFFRYITLAAQTVMTCMREFFRTPEVFLMGRDLAYHPLVTLLSDGKKLKHLILTASSARSQEIWVNYLPGRSFTSHMIWYATNTRPFRFRGTDQFSEFPPIRFIQVDQAWTWTPEHARWIEAVTKTTKAESCGPITYKLSETKAVEKNLDILLFDVTPVSYRHVENDMLPGMYYYYHEKNMKKFFQDVLEWSDQNSLNKRIGLKAKRDYHHTHDPSYIDYVRNLASSNRLELLPPRENVYELISRARVVIVTPFSSPAYIAQSLNVPVAFYDPTGLLDKTEQVSSDIELITSRSELHNWLSKQLPRTH